jgi:ABC-type transport system involved in cytochrome c biogenesis permease subunit
VAPLEAILFWVTLVLYAAASGGMVYGLVFRNERFIGRMVWAATIAFGLHAGTIVARYVAQGHLPWAGDYENGLFGGWFIVAFTLFVAWRQRPLQIIAVATLPLAFLLMGYGAMRQPALEGGGGVGQTE